MTLHKKMIATQQQPHLGKNEGEGELFVDKLYTQSEYREVCENLRKFFSILKQWSEEMKSEA